MTRPDPEKLRRLVEGAALPDYFARLILQRIEEGVYSQHWLDSMCERILYLETVLKSEGDVDAQPGGV